MPLAAGTRLGPYEVVAALGAGGMGEVYKAHDARLGRDVALKILPEAFALDPDRLARFRREAQVLASLNHPNIAQIYGVEESHRNLAIVMELVPGHTLEAIVQANGPRPMTKGTASSETVGLWPSAFVLSELVSVATQIALALETAHEKGVIHRDLKPANIKLASGGTAADAGDATVKVLDFGLAKALGPDAADGSADAMNSPTLTAHATAAGIILGTAAYMSPEQARGRGVDQRTDIWSFGVVLFELLTGKRLFQGETVSDTLAAVLRQDIDWRLLPADTPAELRRLLRRCLERDRRKRLQHIGDARVVLEEIARGETEPPVATAGPPARRALPVWLAAAGLAAALALGVLVGRLTSRDQPVPASTTPVRLTVVPPDVTALLQPALSPDGSFMIVEGLRGGASELLIQRFDEASPRRLDRTEGASRPVLSPDGHWIGFQRGTRIERIAVDGGDPLLVAENVNPGPGAVWTPDGTIIVPQGWVSGLIGMPAAGGTPRTITTPDKSRGERSHWYPSPLPGGRSILMTVIRAGAGLNDADIAVLDLTTGRYDVLLPGAAAVYVAPGYLVFYRAGTYQAVRFDPESRKVSGEPVRVFDDARPLSPDGDRPRLAAAASGTAVYVVAPVGESKLTWVAAGGATEQLPFAARVWEDISLSPDRRRAAAGVREGGRYVLRILGLEAGRHPDEPVDLPGSSWQAFWHSDGRTLAFRSMRKGEYDTYTKDLGSSSPATAVLSTDADESPLAWMPDGTLIVTISEADGRYPIFRVTPGKPGSLEKVTSVEINTADVSPDGRWLAYTSPDSGRPEVSVLPLFQQGPAERVTSQGGQAVAWSRNGRELYFARPPDILAVAVREENGRLKLERERLWANVPGSNPEDVFDVGADGRILVDLYSGTPPPPQLRVVFGAAAELERKLRR